MKPVRPPEEGCGRGAQGEAAQDSAIPIRLDGVALEVRAGESVLDACLRSALSIPFSCRGGVCQACVLRCVQGEVPPRAQRGLAPERRQENYLLACQCRPTGPLDLLRPAAGDGAAGMRAEAALPEPDPALWAELGDGTLVRQVLEDFYAHVYRDARLAPYFHGVTMERAIDKQYSFMRQLMTGERVYFGDRPRNAHHWMVISGELFDYRQALMQARLAAHGATGSQIGRWMRLEEHYRADIVKDAPRPRRVDGVDLPLEGYGSLVLDCGTVCDHCGAALDAGTEVTYHLRLGHVSCCACAGKPL